MDHVFVDAEENGELVFEVTDSSGSVKAKAGLISVLLKADEKHVFVAWHAERFAKQLAKDRALIDLYQVAWPLAALGTVKDRKLETLAEWCGVSYADKTAADRLRVARECYFRLMERLRVGLKVEDVGRTLASGLAEKALQIVGRLAT